ncbi:MAG: MFS transporter [Promethearchaeota archaeon]|nr:MAG: MFS transporter [Candidatus Lokiarchaeota archaeon]
MNHESKIFLLSYFIISIGTPSQFIFAVKKADPLTGALMVGFYFIFSAIASIIFSHLSDRLMRRKIFAIIGFNLVAIIFVAYFFVSSPIELIFCASLVGIGFSAYNPTSTALFSEMEPMLPSGKLMSYFFVVASGGWALGSIIQGIIDQFLGDFVFIFGAAITLIGMTVYLIKINDIPYYPNNLDTTNNPNSILKNPNLQLYSLLILILSLAILTRHLGIQGGFALFPNYLEEGLGTEPFLLSLILAANMSSQALLMIPIGKLVDHNKFGRRITLLLGLSTAFIAVLAWSFIRIPWILVFPQMLVGFSWVTLATSSTALITDITTRKTRSQGLGWFDAGLAIGGSIGPLVAALLYVQSGESFTYAFQILSIFPIIGFFLVLLTFSEDRLTHQYTLIWEKRKK